MENTQKCHSKIIVLTNKLPTLKSRKINFGPLLSHVGQILGKNVGHFAEAFLTLKDKFMPMKHELD